MIGPSAQTGHIPTGYPDHDWCMSTACVANKPTSRTTTSIPVRGDFSLAEVAMMGFGHRHEQRFDGVMRLAFCIDADGYSGHGAVEVRQPAADTVGCTVVAGEPVAAVAQVARVLSLDHDGEGFREIGRRDPVIGRLQQIAFGLRPPLFHSAYEAATWAIISSRRSARQMGPVRQQLAAQHGTVFDLAGQEVAAFPTPDQLLAVHSFPGLDRVKIGRLHAIADAARAGELDTMQLRAGGTEAARARLLQFAGIGPFYASLIEIRALGFTDELAIEEPRLLDAVGRLYGFGRPVTAAEITELAETWRPFRTWTTVLIRATVGRQEP